MSNADEEAAKFQVWIRRMRRRAVRELMRANVWNARANAQSAKARTTPRRGAAATAAGLLQQRFAAEKKEIMALVGELARLAMEPLPADGRVPVRRRRARRRRPRAPAMRPVADAQ
jgi:hypothetical protein